jgi:hypothetical protein
MYLNTNRDMNSIVAVQSISKSIPSKSLEETNINEVCIKRNKESNPSIPGVMMLLFVMV